MPAQTLDAVEDILLLRGEGVNHLLHPIEIAVELREHLREPHQEFYARVPLYRRQYLDQRVTLEILVCRILQPALCLDDLQRKRRRHQHLCEQRVGIERD